MKIIPKKSLGQNFLTNQKAIFEIVSAGEIEKDEIILEIGPGKGALTEKILENKNLKKLYCIEKDDELINFLKEKFQKEILENKIEIIHQDILIFQIETILKKEKIEEYKIIANIPYYITGAIIEKFLEEKIRPKKMILLIQKEVGERIVAKNKKESILSLATRFYGESKIIYKVSAGSFFPKPKVDSLVLGINLKNDIYNTDKNFEKKYLEIIKKAFSHKRKILIGNLKTEFKKIEKYENINWEEILEKLKISKNIRAEDLKKEDFINICKEI